jgi:UDP-N-acetylmuramoyl-tripeptide--D-alanyl-D-alanine ligase
MRLSVPQVAEFLGVSIGQANFSPVEGWSIDSRTIRPGDLFIALRGPNHDGHLYIEEVFRKGAVAAIVDREIPGSAQTEGRVLRVEDTLQALQLLGRRARQSWGGRVVAVTGSAGKTTTKDIIAEMLTEGYATTKNQGNLNNHIGLPLSLLRLEESAKVAVLELGMNHAGEIRELAHLADPDTAVVTNVGWAHIENFESIEGIAAAGGIAACLRNRRLERGRSARGAISRGTPG